MEPDRQVGNESGEFVLYWMHNALRAHENPALDVAICLARQNDLPLLVYHGLSEDYPFASDRHHAFMLQGHRDVQRQLSDREISAAFHLQRQGKRGPYLRSLTRRAAVLITEEMPIQPLSSWLERLVATCNTPIAVVDCTCIAPVTMVESVFTEAEEFRRHVQPLYDERLDLPYVEQEIDVARCDVDALSRSVELEPLSLQDVSLAALIGQCRIDHSVAPVADTPGGSRAGYLRWNRYKKRGLDQYAKDHSDPTRADSASRMSAYLHYGMVSPFRIAREASERKAKSFLDSLLTWRELAFHFCFHHCDIIDTLDAVPDWAKETLLRHSDDGREANCSWETLARAQTGRAVWDAAQRSLLKHGELHGKVRKIWGKSILPWLSTPSRALQLTLDLNHRYSLDGRNPASYGGVLWCYGQFDRPCEPEKPVFGSIRPREVRHESETVDLEHFVQFVDRPIASILPTVAVVGAGIAGLAVARTLADYDVDVTVFEKEPGIGECESPPPPLSDCGKLDPGFDRSSQHLTTSDSRFSRIVNSWLHDGIIKPWTGRIVELDTDGKIRSESIRKPRFVGVPDMTSIVTHLANGLNIHTGTPIVDLTRGPNHWLLECVGGKCHGPFDVVLCSCPPKSTLALIDGHADFAKRVRSVKMRPRWSMVIADQSLSQLPFDEAFIDGGPISRLTKIGGNPDHMALTTCIIHASVEWSQTHLRDTPDQVVASLRQALDALLAKPLNAASQAIARRRIDATFETPVDQDSLFDPTAGIGVCGDWCGGTQIETAYLSGIALAGSLLRHYTIDRPAYRKHEASGQ
jgi:photolyase PhrII